MALSFSRAGMLLAAGLAGRDVRLDALAVGRAFAGRVDFLKSALFAEMLAFFLDAAIMKIKFLLGALLRLYFLSIFFAEANYTFRCEQKPDGGILIKDDQGQHD